MAIVFEETLKKNIAEDRLLPVYILFGEDGFLKKNYQNKILKLITDEDDVFNCCRFDGNCDLQEVYNATMQLPFMADKKFVELCDYDFEHCSKSDFDRLCELVGSTPDTSVLVIRFDNISFDTKKSTKFKKLVSAAEKNKGIAARLDHRKMPELVKMLSEGAKKRGCSLDSSVARYLIETAGDDIFLLSNELDKLCFFAKGEAITKDIVDKVSIKTVGASIYNLSQFIMSCDITSSIKLLDELFFMRIEPIIILSTVSSVYVDMMRVSVAKSRGLSIKDVAEKYGYKGREFVLDKAKTNLRKFDRKKLYLSLSELTKADNSLKSFGAEPRVILEQLIVKLIYIIAKGEAVDKA